MKTFTELKRYLKKHNLSISWAAQRFAINYNTLRNLLSGNSGALNSAALTDLQEKVQAFLDEAAHQEQLLYERIFPAVCDVPTVVSKPVLRTILTDLDAL